MRRRLPITAILAIVLTAGIFLAAPFMSAKKSPRTPDSAPRSEQRLKARHLYLLGAQKDAEGKVGEAYEYYRRAYAADPSYEEAGYSLGLLRVALTSLNPDFADPAEAGRSLDMARPLVERYPGDFLMANNYAYLASAIDSTDQAVNVYRRLLELQPSKTQVLISLSETYSGMKQPDSALNMLDRYERMEGKSTQLTARKAVMRVYNNDTTGAIREVDQLIATNPRNYDYRLLKGRIYDYIQKPDSALAEYLAAEQLDPQSGVVKMVLAQYYGQHNDSAAYDQRMYQSLLSADLELGDKLSVLATYLQKLINDKGDTQRGDKLFDVLMSQYPHDANILDLSARFSAAKKDYATAIEEVGYALDLNRQRPDLWNNLMMYQISAERPRDAMKSLPGALAAIDALEKAGGDPDELDSARESVLLLYAMGAQAEHETDSALNAIQDVMAMYTPYLNVRDSVIDLQKIRNLEYGSLMRLSDLYQMAGDALYAAKPPRLQETYKAYDNSLKINADNAMTLNNYAYFIITNDKPEPGSERFEQAKSMSKKSLDINPKPSSSYDTYAWILFKGGEFKDALTYQQAALEKALTENTVSAELYSHLGDILFMNGEVDAAVENWKKALAIEPEDALLKKKVEHRTFFYE